MEKHLEDFLAADGDQISIIARSTGGSLLHLSRLGDAWSFQTIGTGPGSYNAATARGQISVVTQPSTQDDATIYIYDGVTWA